MKRNVVIISSIIGVILIVSVILLMIGSHTKQSQHGTNSSQEQNTPPTTAPQPSSMSLSPTVPVGTAASEDHAHDLELQHQLQAQPDIYVSNYLPYETADFAASASFTENPTSHFYCIVTAKTGDTSIAKQQFEQWLQSIGLSQQQIAQLDIRYQME